MAKLKVKPREGKGRCPYCMDELQGEVVACTCGAEPTGSTLLKPLEFVLFLYEVYNIVVSNIVLKL